MRNDGAIGWHRELVEILEIQPMNTSFVIIQVQYDGNYPLWFGNTPDSSDFFIVPCV